MKGLPGVLYSANRKIYAQLSDKAREMRANPTEAEKILWVSLRNKKLGVKFRRQHIIDRFIADFCSIEAALIIEVDGEVHESREDADSERTIILESYGYSVLRFTNEDVIYNTDQAILEIKIILESVSTSPS